MNEKKLLKLKKKKQTNKEKMMEISDISAPELIAKFQELFPKEVTIALQALRISKLEEALSGDGVSDNTEEA